MSAPDHRFVCECRDAVHGFVKLSRAEWEIVDTRIFQRLRDIRQLAMAHLVYPGATHTRFEHSLGCVHLSTLVYEAIRDKIEAKACPDFAQAFGQSDVNITRGLFILRLASLLHDLGHTPFSHSGEHLMPLGPNGTERISHEDMSAALIRSDEIASIIRDEFKEYDIDPEEVVAVATKPKLADGAKLKGDLRWYKFLNQILAGELGSDRIDYLLRDGVHSGQASGRFDHLKLINSLVIAPPPEETGEDHRLGLDEGGWLIAEQMVSARYLMYISLYFHKTKRIYEKHLEEFLGSWLRQTWGQPVFPTNVDEYAGLTDSRVWAAIYEAAGTNDPLGALGKRFVNRDHFRLACELIPADNHKLAAQSSDNLWHGATLREWDADRFDRLAEFVSKKFGSHAIVCDNMNHVARKFHRSKDRIWVLIGGKTRFLDDLSELVRGMPAMIARGRIYADNSNRSDVRAACEEWLQREVAQ